MGVLSIQQFVAESNNTVLEQSVYFNDLAPSDFFFIFSKLKGIIEKIYFEGEEAMKRAVTTELSCLQEGFFLQLTESWQIRMGKCSRLEKITLKWKPCTLSFGIKIIICDTSPVTFQT